MTIVPRAQQHRSLHFLHSIYQVTIYPSFLTIRLDNKLVKPIKFAASPLGECYRGLSWLLEIQVALLHVFIKQAYTEWTRSGQKMMRRGKEVGEMDATKWQGRPLNWQQVWEGVKPNAIVFCIQTSEGHHMSVNKSTKSTTKRPNKLL